MQVIGALSQALREVWKPHVEQLLEPMALTGLSQELVLALQACTQAWGPACLICCGSHDGSCCMAHGTSKCMSKRSSDRQCLCSL